MKELLKKLCNINAVSGDEDALREVILAEILPYCEASVDPLGNIIAFKKGKKRPGKKLMIDAHMDEVGLIITSITDDVFLRFETVGGTDEAVLLSRGVKIGKHYGVITSKPIHLTEKDERDKYPKISELFIDIGARDKAEAEKMVPPGSRAAFCSEFCELGDKIMAKAIDDRAGCAVLIKLIKAESEYDFYATFTVCEEIGCTGAAAATFTVNPDAALVLEATTAADIAGVDENSKVCSLGEGVAVSFMDRSTLYNAALYKKALDTAKSNGIKCQIKQAVAGGNNSGKIHTSVGGVATLALSVPCRYIHSPSCVADINDVNACFKLAQKMIEEICGD